MSYVTSVGGDPINPLIYTYSSISMTGNIALVWPSNNQDATYTATDWVDITSSAAYTITMPPANEAGTGNEVVFYNYGGFTITINDSTGGNITTIATGLTKRVWITDNSTAAGTWRVANIGSGTTNVDASALAGYGLIAQAGQLSQSMPPAAFATNATLNAGYRSYLVIWTGGAGTLTLTSPVTLGANWFVNVKNAGTGTLTINSSGANIDGQSTINVSTEEGFIIATNGATFYTVGRITPTTSGYTLLSKSVTGSTDITLSASESAYSIINYTGTLGSSIHINVPAAVNEWIMNNASTGSAYTLTIKTSSGSGEVLNQGDTRELYCDGTNVYFSDPQSEGTVFTLNTGTGLTGGPISGTGGTVAIGNTAVVAGSYGSVSKAAIYTVNAQGQLTSSTDATIDVSGVTGTLPVAHGGTSLATLTANNVILGNGTSAPQFVSPSGTGNVLTATGTTWTSSAITSGMVLLATVNASAAASVAFSSTYITSTYNTYVIIFDNVFSSAGAPDLYFTQSTNNGVSYINSGYAWSGVAASSGTVTGKGSTSDSRINITLGTGGVATSGAVLGGAIYFNSPSSSSYLQLWWNLGFQEALTTTPLGGSGGGSGTSPTNNVKLALSSGNISGNFHLYGVAGT